MLMTVVLGVIYGNKIKLAHICVSWYDIIAIG